MPDTQTDPVQARLITAPVPNSVRADAWDAFQQSKDADELAQRLAAIKIPDNVKADLWDMKHANATTQSDHAPADSEGLIDHIKNWATSGKVAEDLKNVAIGAIKQPGRLVQGAASGLLNVDFPAITDRAYGLPSGASAQAMQPENTAQKVGGYLADAAEVAGAGAADAGIVGSRYGVGTSTQAGRILTRATEIGSDVSQGAIAAAKSILLSGGPVTAEKIGAAVSKYGIDAAKLALKGLGLGAGLEAWKYVNGK